MKLTKINLEKLYTEFDKKEFVNPDPLMFLYDYKNPLDREIVGLIASSLAYGRVTQILKSISFVLGEMQSKGGPRKFIEKIEAKELKKIFKGFKHRFTTDVEMIAFLLAIKKVIEKNNSLQEFFCKNLTNKDENIMPALTEFVNGIRKLTGLSKSSLLPDPQKGSACKRLHLFLRWMARVDNVDPGGWTEVSPRLLIIPLDTHMYQFAINNKITTRKQADIITAIEITNYFKKFAPLDPSKYDFAITRTGIWKNNDPV